MTTGSSRVVAAYNELSTGELRLGPPKSAAGRRVVALPAEIVPELTEHLATSAQPGADGLVFVTTTGQPLRRSNFNKSVRWHESSPRSACPGPGSTTYDTRATPSPRRSPALGS